MPADIIVGLQWGDEGKGKIVDLISKNYDIVVRYQGGANAGHTVVIKNQKYVLHLIPSGIFSDKICIIGNGTVIDLHSIINEIEYLNKLGVDVKDKLYISNDAHVILPYHKLIDSFNEATEKIGTTKKGIGPAYNDKYNRIGIKLSELSSKDSARKKIEQNFNNKLKRYPLLQELNFEEMFGELMSAYGNLKQYVRNTQIYLSEALINNKNILLEGAQGSLLDIDFGTYPFVTSSHPTAGGACIGSGIPPTSIKNIIGITKAYTTRVGEGPFPTELLDETGDKIRDIGHEYGSTTNRPRRCGWLDLMALKYSCRINGVTNIALTKIDVLNTFSKIKMCVNYKNNGNILKDFTSDVNILKNIEPVYEEVDGWNCQVNENTTIDKIDINLKKYISKIEEYTGVQVKYLSVGSGRDETIIK